jgi:hypothetical protein
MTAEEFENLDELAAELWIARRFRQFVKAGFPVELSLMFAVHPAIEAPRAGSTAAADTSLLDSAA